MEFTKKAQKPWSEIGAGRARKAQNNLRVELDNLERIQMTSIRVPNDGLMPTVDKGRESPFKQGEYYVFDVEDDIARYWNKQSQARKVELSKQSRKEGKDIRLILEGFVHKPRKMK